MIFRSSILLAFLSGISVLLGIIRDRLLSEYVGVGPVLDVYNASFRIPDLALGFMLSFATASTVVPFLTQSKNDGSLEKRFSTLFYFFSWAMILVSVFVVITVPLYAQSIAPGFNAEQMTMFIMTTRILMLQPILIGVSSLISTLAQMRHEFVIYGVAPLLYTLGIIFGTIFLFPQFGITGLVFGVVIGAGFHLGFQSYTLFKAKINPFKYAFSLEYLKDHMKVSIPRSGTYIVSQLRIIFYTAFATTLGVGVLSSFLFAQKITDAISQMLAQSVSSASLPTLSQHFEEGNHSHHKRIIFKYSVGLFISGLFIALIIFGLQDFLVSLLYGKTQAHETIKFFLLAFTIVLPLQVVTWYLATGFNSMKKTNIVMWSNTIATAVSVVVCIYMKEIGIAALAYGIIAMNVTYFLIIFSLYLRKSKLYI
ncbi:MAG: lipid II flippase MurJ [Candidatus Paceibacterota bacterium]|jgi:putative peptidoglycan lipid II flippase